MGWRGAVSIPTHGALRGQRGGALTASFWGRGPVGHPSTPAQVRGGPTTAGGSSEPAPPQVPAGPRPGGPHCLGEGPVGPALGTRPVSGPRAPSRGRPGESETRLPGGRGPGVSSRGDRKAPRQAGHQQAPAGRPPAPPRPPVLPVSGASLSAVPPGPGPGPALRTSGVQSMSAPSSSAAEQVRDWPGRRGAPRRLRPLKIRCASALEGAQR